MKLPPIPANPTPADVGNVSAPRAAAVAQSPPHPTPPSVSDNAAAAVESRALHELVDKLSQTIGTTGQKVHFSVDQDTHQTVLRVTDAESGALLRQIPGDEALSMARILDRMQGILIKQKA